MKKKGLLVACCALLLSGVEALACTGLLVGKKASIDGSVMISYAADSHGLYGEMYHWPAATWPKGATLDVVEWDTGKPLGTIAQVERTYNVVGNMNEHQLAITESTFGGRRELRDTAGIMDYGSLIYITLQRAKTAREAIKVMTDLVAEYGYYSGGETFSIADKHEAWVMEMVGKGPGRKGAIWVAIRIPDDCISAHANQSRIQQIPFDDKENCLYAPDVVSFAREKGYFKGKDADFSFQQAYCPYDFGALRGCEARVWSFFRQYDPAMDQYSDFIKGDPTKQPMPLYIKPNRKLSVQDVQQGMRNHYEGTDLDMTKDAGAGPYKVPYRWRPMTFKVDGVEYTNERAIATQQTGFVIVPQMREWLPDEIGGILWFGVDDANTAVFLPMYCCITEVPESYRRGKGDLYNFDFDAAFWVNNLVANQAYNRYSQMIPDIRKVQSGIEDKCANDQPAVESRAQDLLAKNPAEAVEYLTNYSVNTAQNATSQYQELAKYLFVKYLDGNRKKEKDGKFLRTETGMPAYPDFPGYTQDYYNDFADPSCDHLKEVEPEK